MTYYNHVRANSCFSYSYVQMVMLDRYTFYFNLYKVKLNLKRKVLIFSAFYSIYDAMRYAKGLSTDSSRTKRSVTDRGCCLVIRSK